MTNARRARWAVGTLQAAPVALLVGYALANAWSLHGSIAAADWLSGAVLSALVLAAVLASGAASTPSRAVLGGIAALVALAAWAGGSLEWSATPTLARDEGLLTLWYAVAVAACVAALRSVESRLVSLWFVVVGLAGLALAVALELRFGSSPLSRYSEGRLSFPITYANAQAGLLALGFWPAVVLAARRSSGIAARAVALAAATACLATTLLAQSKGATIGLIASAIVVAALSPARLRVLVPALLAAVGTAIAFRPLTAPFRAGPAAEAAAIRHSGATVIVLTLVAVVAGAAYALVDRRIELSPAARKRAGRTALVAGVAALAAGMAGGVAAVGNPASFLVDQWNTFTRFPEHERSTHLLTLGSNRYDFWRVDAELFVNHPLAGVGARGFGPAYLIAGRSPETPARGHSVVMDTLAELGIVGFVLLCAGLGLLLFAAARGVRLREAPALAGLAASVCWLVQATVDWTWTFPSLGLVAFALLGIATARGSTPLGARTALPFAAAAAVVGLVVFGAPWISARLTKQAEADGDTSHLVWARRLDPISTAPLLAEARIAPTEGERLAALRAAVRKEPRVVVIRYQLGVAELAAGRRRAARADLRVALGLAPGNPIVLLALKQALRARDER